MENRRCWQIAGTPWNRSYVDTFLHHGVALIGPGDAGRWREDRDDSEFEGGAVRHFANEVNIGDALVLRSGNSRMLAVGIVATEYLYLEQFDDVNGYDLQHARRVRWYRLPAEHDFGKPVFGATPRRFSRVANPDVLELVERFLTSAPTDWQSAPLRALPSAEEDLDEVPTAVQDLVGLARDLGWGLYWEPQRFGDFPSEDEMIVHFVVPFFRSLGWSPENIAIKWRYVDVTLFNALPRTPENCHVVVEAKQLGLGVEGALEQARGYLTKLGVQCDVVVTDGIRYRMYDHANDFAPVAYANLVRLKKSATRLFAMLQRAGAH